LTVTGSITGTVSDALNATRLATARTINGTSFNGTTGITTSFWGENRSIKIGNTTKSVNGSSNYTWTSTDIGIFNGTLTLTATGNGVTSATTTFSANQSTNANFTVNVPGTNLGVIGGTTSGPTITSSTGGSATIPSASSSASGAVTTGTQTFGGRKTFATDVTMSNLSANTISALSIYRDSVQVLTGYTARLTYISGSTISYSTGIPGSSATRDNTGRYIITYSGSAPSFIGISPLVGSVSTGGYESKIIRSTGSFTVIITLNGNYADTTFDILFLV
jgi:hypothetical protein